MSEHLAVAFEWKFAPDAQEGSFEGYGSVFGHQDAHSDIVLPGAFAETLAERKAQGCGLHLHGRLSGMDTRLPAQPLRAGQG